MRCPVCAGPIKAVDTVMELTAEHIVGRAGPAGVAELTQVGDVVVEGAGVACGHALA